jgi:hypothetical protein
MAAQRPGSSQGRRSRSIDLLVTNGVGGALAGAGIALGILMTDGAGLGSLIGSDSAPVAAAALWTLGLAAGFAAFAVATAVIGLGGGDDLSAGPGGRKLRPVPLRVRGRV